MDGWWSLEWRVHLAVQLQIKIRSLESALRLDTWFLELVHFGVWPVVFLLQSDDKQLTPFTDRRSKLYIFKPSNAPESLYVQDDNTKRTSLSYPAGRVSSQTNDSTMYYSPEAASASEFMSALEFQSESSTVDKSPLNKHHHNRLTSPNTSTPKTHAGQRTRASLSHVYRLSGTCCICLEEKADKELIPHEKCGRLFCRQCLQVSEISPN